jgi:hypothetical protein
LLHAVNVIKTKPAPASLMDGMPLQAAPRTH